VFAAAAIRFLFESWGPGGPGALGFLDSRFWLVGAVAALFLASLRWHPLRLAQPFVFLLCALIPFSQTTESAFGFGLFAVGLIMLYNDGHLSTQVLPKLVGLGLYFLGLLAVSSIVTTASFRQIVVLFGFTLVFFLYLFLAFQDRFIVFVNAEKPVVRLADYGLSAREVDAVLAMIRGRSIKEAAWDWGISESTVRNSLSRAYRKLGLQDRTQLMTWAESRTVKP